MPLTHAEKLDELARSAKLLDELAAASQAADDQWFEVLDRVFPQDLREQVGDAAFRMKLAAMRFAQLDGVRKWFEKEIQRQTESRARLILRTATKLAFHKAPLMK